MNAMIRVIYVSQIDQNSFNSTMLQDILHTAKENNQKNDITGVLICDYSHFLQVLEGDNEFVSKTLVNIIKDSRHTNFKLISARDIDKRYFSKWAMEFKELDVVAQVESKLIAQMSFHDIETLLKTMVE